MAHSLEFRPRVSEFDEGAIQVVGELDTVSLLGAPGVQNDRDTLARLVCEFPVSRLRMPVQVSF